MNYNSIYALGDIHGSFQTAKYVAKNNPNDLIIQVGDFGIGFGDNPPNHALPSNLKFFQGNHDNYKEMEAYDGYLGRFGIIPDSRKRIMFIAGAETPNFDIKRRTPGVDWWDHEHLSIEELDRAIEFAKDFKPEIVLSHDGPQEVVREMFKDKIMPSEPFNESLTRNALQVILDETSPEAWWFGHWHMYRTLQYKNTTCTCLGLLQAKKIL